MRYINFILGQLKLFGMIIFAFFMFPFITYPRRKEIWDMRFNREKKWYWKYSDTSETWGTEEQNYLNSTYGVYELVQLKDEDGNYVVNSNGDILGDYDKFLTFGKLRKWFISYHWLVFRNGCWNYIASKVPKQGQWENVVCKGKSGDADCLTWRDKKVLGKQSITWEVDGEKQFRYSFTKVAKWYNIQTLLAFLFTFKWHKYYNFMWGMADDRYLVKTRTFNLD